MVSGVAKSKKERETYNSLKKEIVRLTNLADEEQRRLERLKVDEAEEARLRTSIEQLRFDEAQAKLDTEAAIQQQKVTDAALEQKRKQFNLAGSGVEKAQKERGEYRSLKDELGRLTTLIDEAKRRHEGFQVDEIEEKRLQTSIAQLREDEGKAKSDATIAIQKQKEANALLEKTRKEYVSQQTAHVRLSGENAEISKKHGIAKERHDALASNNDALEGGIKEKARQESTHIADLTADARKELASVNTKLGIARNELENMKADRTAAAELKQEIIVLGQRVKDLAKEKLAAERIVNEFAQAAKKRAEQLRVERIEHERACAAREQELSIKAAKLSDREGQVNFVKENLKKKTGLLRQAKRELEDFHGKQLRHIIIPEDNVIEDI